MTVFSHQWLFDPTIHEVRDVGILLRFGGAVLLQTSVCNHLPQQLVEWFWREGNVNGEVLFHLREGDHIQLRCVAAFEALEIGKAQRLHDLAGAIGPEVEHQNAVAVLDEAVLKPHRFEEFIGDVLGITIR